MDFLKATLSGVTINPTVSLEGSNLTFCLNPDDQEHLTYEANLDEVVAQYSQDHGVVAVGEAKRQLLTVETTAISIFYRGSPFVDTHGTARRDSPLSVYRSFEPGNIGWPATFILTPFKGCLLSDCALYFVVSDGQGNITINGQPLIASAAPLLPVYLKDWLPITFTGATQVQAGGSVPLTIVAPENTEVHLEALAGTLSRSRVRNGDVVMFHANDLTPGLQARIKAGYKYWPGKTDLVVEVV